MNNNYFNERQQGDIIRISTDLEENDYAIVSQTCDVVQPKRETVLLAPVIKTLTAVEMRGASDRSNPRYVLINDRAIDLGKIHYVAKESISGAVIVGGLDTLDNLAARDFALSVGRWFSRFAVPDELHPWLVPLQKLIRSKYSKENSPLHTVLQDVVEVRVEADQWFSPGRHITIHTIVKAAALPLDFPTSPVISPLTSKKSSLSPGILATEMIKAGAPYSVELWDQMAWAFADTCKLGGSDRDNPLLVQAVAEVGAELWSEDDFPLSHMRRSEQLDIDFLSDPQPL